MHGSQGWTKLSWCQRVRWNTSASPNPLPLTYDSCRLLMMIDGDDLVYCRRESQRVEPSANSYHDACGTVSATSPCEVIFMRLHLSHSEPHLGQALRRMLSDPQLLEAIGPALNDWFAESVESTRLCELMSCRGLA